MIILQLGATLLLSFLLQTMFILHPDRVVVVDQFMILFHFFYFCQLGYFVTPDPLLKLDYQTIQ